MKRLQNQETFKILNFTQFSGCAELSTSAGIVLVYILLQAQVCFMLCNVIVFLSYT